MTDLFAAEDIEKLFRETGGVEVSVFGTDTWGTQRTDDGLFEDRPDGAEDVVEIPTGVLPQDMKVDVAITVDGEAQKVLDHRRVDDGAITVVMYGDWTHTVDIYRPDSQGEFPRTSGQQQLQFDEPLASGISCDLMALSGEVRAERSGDRPTAEWEGRFPPGTDLQPGDYLKVTAGTGPKRHRVLFVGDRTDRWKIPVETEESDEDF